MADSSEEEIININRRIRQPAKKGQGLEELFDEEEREIGVVEESIESVGYDERDSLFYEIFGTGEEYNYVYEEEEKESEASEPTIEEEDAEVDVDEIYKYVMSNSSVDPEPARLIVEALNKGYNIHFALLHGKVSSVGIEEGYEILDLLEEHKEFVKLRRELERQDGSELLRGICSLESLKLYPNYRKASCTELRPCKELLTVEEFCDNLRAKEMLHKPEYSDAFHLYEEEEELVRRMSLHPIFQHTIYRLYREQGTGDDILCVDRNRIREELVRFYCSGLTEEDEWDRYREKIVLEAVERVTAPGFFRKILMERKEKEGKRKALDEVIDRIVNGAVRRPISGSYICGMTLERKYVKAAMLDFEGNLVEACALREEQMEEVQGFLRKYMPYSVAVGGSSPAVMYLFRSLHEWNPVFVESHPAKLSARDAVQFCCNVARLVQCPEIEYSNLLALEYLYVQSELPATMLSKVIGRGILTALSIVGIDVNYLMLNKRTALVSLLGLSESFVSELGRYGHVARLEELKKLCAGPIEYANCAVYLRIFSEIFPGVSSTDILDSTPIHPKNYGLARTICAESGSHGEASRKSSSECVEDVLRSSKAALRSSLTGISLQPEDHDASVDSLLKTLINCDRPVFEGLPDHLVFVELTGITESLIGQAVDGRVFKCADTFFLVRPEKYNATVYVRKSPETPGVYLNQMVRVEISELTDFMLSYTGKLVEQAPQRGRTCRFTSHPLFRELDSRGAEEYLRSEEGPLVLRRSGKDGSPVLVLRIDDDIYIHIKVEEGEKYYHEGKEYDDIDELISKVARRILANVREIKKHKCFFGSEDEAYEYLREESPYIRYAFCLSRSHPGKLCLMIRRDRIFKEYLGVGERLSYDGRKFASLDEFMRYRKRL
jgi:transcription elongation factor SPT6